MGGGKRGDKLDRCLSKSTPVGAGEMDETTCESPMVNLEATLAALLSSTNKRIDELNITLITNQERRLSKLEVDMRTEIVELRTKVTELREYVSFTADEVKDIKK